MSFVIPGRPGRHILLASNLVAALAIDGSAAQAQTSAAAGNLPPVEVSPPVRHRIQQAKPARDAGQGLRRVATPRVARHAPADQKPAVHDTVQIPVQTPLNSNAVAESASRLGLPAREIPATVEVISQQKIQEQGYRTVSDVAQGAVGVTSGDNPSEPSAFSTRGYTNSQINTLYNGIKIGPQNMTGRFISSHLAHREIEILPP